jgi:hypothetical protein
MTSPHRRQPRPVRAIELRATFSADRNALRKASELESTLVVKGSRGEFLIRGDEPAAVVREARRIVEIIKRASEGSKDFKQPETTLGSD